MFGVRTWALGGALLLACTGSGWVGYRLAAGGYEARLHAQSVQYAEGWRRAVEAADRDARAERARAVSAAEARGRASTQVQEVISASAADPGPVSCEWRDSQRLRLDAIYRSYADSPEATPD